MLVLGSLKAYQRLAQENVADAVAAGLDYASLHFSTYYMAMTHPLPLQGVVEAIIDGVQSASSAGDRQKWQQLYR